MSLYFKGREGGIPKLFGFVIIIHNMQYHVIIGSIAGMPMNNPIRRLYMNFNIASPLQLVYANACIEKIWPGIMVVLSWMYDLHPLSGAAVMNLRTEIAELPYMVQEVFSHVLTGDGYWKLSIGYYEVIFDLKDGLSEQI